MKNTPFYYLFAAMFFLASCGGGAEKDPSLPTSDSTDTSNLDYITGNYTYGDIKDKEGGGYLAMQVLEKNQIKFELDINLGAPKFHSGTASGIATVENNIATWSSTEFTNQPCKIIFTFAENKVIVDQVEGNDSDCGFGAGVVATGEYIKQSNEVKFPHEEEINAALKDVMNNINGTYQTTTEPKGELVVEKLGKTKVKIKYNLTAEQTITGEAVLEKNIAILDTENYQLSLTFLANNLIETKLTANKEALPSSVPTDAVLSKINDKIQF